MYCELAYLKQNMPNNLFERGSLIDDDTLEKICAQVSARMDTRFLTAGHEVPLDDDYIDDLLRWPMVGGGGDPPGPKIIDTVRLANIYGVRQMVYSTIATDDDEESHMASMNEGLFETTMDDILKALAGDQTSGVSNIGSRGRQPIVRLRDSGLW